jgi:iron complex outermembrane recepter protein
MKLSSYFTQQLTHKESKQMNGIKPITRCLALAFGGSLVIASTSVYAQSTPAAPAQKQERIEVTGSNIKRIDSETVSPVSVITREEIERSGKATIADVLRDIPGNQGNSFNETFTNSFSPGAAGVSLRGLGQKSTLVLINGRRMANYGFAQNLQDSYVDINSIPSSAVERIEILKDGASAVYGADAVAGVVNIIMRKDYRGASLGASSGTTSEGGMNEYRLNLTAGMGEVGADKFNVFGVLDFYHRDLLTWSERSATKDNDFRSWQGGTFGWSSNGGTLRSGNNRTALQTCPVSTDQRLNIKLASATLTGSGCYFNTAPYLTLMPKTDRLGFFGKGTFEFTPTLNGFAELGLSHNKTEQAFTPAFVRGTVITAAGGVTTLPLNLTATNPAYGAGGPELMYAFREFGGRDAVITTDAGRVLLGVKGTLGSWDYESAVGAAKSDTSQLNKNRLLAGISADNAVLSGYDFSHPNPNSPLLLPYKVDLTRKANSQLQSFDIKANSDLFAMSGGNAAIAIGLEHRREKLKDSPDPISSRIVTTTTGSGAAPILNNQVYSVVGQGDTATNANRNNTALFSELSLPIIKSLEAQIALRHDRYSDFGNATSPKVGVKWTPIPELAIRANYGKGFRAPTLPEVSPSKATFFTNIQDPTNGRVYQIAGIFNNNPNLKAELSTSKNLGLVIEPNKNVSFGITWYELNLKDKIEGNIQNAIDRNALGDPAYAANVTRDPLNNNLILYAQDVYRNVSNVKVRGGDLDFRIVLVPSGENGKWTFRGEVDYMDKYFVKADAESDEENVVDYNGSNTTNALPRTRFSAALDWDIGSWRSTVSYRYTAGTKQSIVNTPNVINPTRRSAVIGSYEQFDASVAYEGIKNVKITGSILNVFNRRPPYDPAYASGVDFTLYDLRGRTYALGATYTFK